MSADTPATICLLGFGEVGRTLAQGFRERSSVDVSAYDLLFADTSSAPYQAQRRFPEVRFATSAAAAAGNVDLVISAVTAAQDLVAAESVSRALAPGTWFLDVNSVSPGTKQAVGELVEASGGRYVEAAIMSPIHPHGAASPMLLGGRHAVAFADAAQAIGFTAATVYSDDLGKASAAKMCRSVVIKGLEALLTESMLAARRYGVERTVLETLDNVISGDDWESRAHYLLSRSLEHGERRAEEMREVAATVAEAGIEPWMSDACAKRQQRTASFGPRAGNASLPDLLDAIIRAQYPIAAEKGDG